MFTISAQQHDSAIRAYHGSMEFDSPFAALSCLARFVSGEPFMKKLDDGDWWIWRSRDSYERDSDGSAAIATVSLAGAC